MNSQLRAFVSRRKTVHFRSCCRRKPTSFSSLLSHGNDDVNGSRYYSAVTATTTPAQAAAAATKSICLRGGVQHHHHSSTSFTRLMSSAQQPKQEERLLIIGSGVAGCSAALIAAKAGIPVTIIHAGSTAVDCNSYWAQGGIIYRNYNLYNKSSLTIATTDAKSSQEKLVDTTLSLVNDIRIASGYVSPLARNDDNIDECLYTKDMHVNNTTTTTTTTPPPPLHCNGNSGVVGVGESVDGKNGVSELLGRKCNISGVTWNEDAAWKLALEGPTRVRQLLLGHVDFDSSTITADDASTAATTTAATTNNTTTESVGETKLFGGTRCVIDFDRSSSSSSSISNNDSSGGNNVSNDESGLSLCLEASHSAPRIVHQADTTGRAITEGITATAAHHPLINFMSDSIVVDLLYDDHHNDNDHGTVVIGARILDTKTNTITNQYAVHGVVLASGGLCGIYEHTTNPHGFNALGSSVALALRLEDDLLGCGGGSGGNGGEGGSGIVSDLEYVQFHPTALCIPNESRFLLTEALRGEGALLRDANGRAFAKDYHVNGELAPRDVVARAVYAEMSRKSTPTGQRWESNWETVHHSDFVGQSNYNWATDTAAAAAAAAPVDVHNAYLDITHRDAEWLINRFPGVHAYLMSRSVPLDFTRDMIPVTPAAHYTCGGVTTDLGGRVMSTTTTTAGNNRLQYRNLYAAGEAARTGLHGGNRLASTSLLEGLVFGSSVGDIVATADDGAALMADCARRAIARRLATTVGPYYTTSWSATTANDAIAREATAILTRLKSVMWNDVGVVRNPAGLEHAVSELTAMCDEAERLWATGEGGREAAALRDASRSGLAVADAALRNRISGGCHYLAPPMAETEQQNESDDDDDEDDGQARA